MFIKLLLFKILNRISPALAGRWAVHLFVQPRRIPRPAHEDELIQKAERVVFKCGLVAYKFGQGSRKAMLVHGWEGRGTQLGFFAEPLVEQGFTVYALDGPAHGESPGEQLNPVLYATFIKTIAIELNGIEVVIAHSFGAGSTVLAATNAMDLQKIVFIAGPDRYSRVVDGYCRMINASEKTREWILRLITQRAGLHPEQMQVSQLAKNLRQKILLIHDRNDKSVPFDAAESIQTQLPQADFLFTEGLGHRRILKDPRVIERVLKFVKD